jgi:hypothetical protein
MLRRRNGGRRQGSGALVKTGCAWEDRTDIMKRRKLEARRGEARKRSGGEVFSYARIAETIGESEVTTGVIVLCIRLEAILDRSLSSMLEVDVVGVV